MTKRFFVEDKGNFWLSILHALLFVGTLFCATIWYDTDVYLSLFLFSISCINLVLSMMNMVPALKWKEDSDL